MGDLGLCLLVHAWFWLVAAVSISFQRAPLQTLTFALFIIAITVSWKMVRKHPSKPA